MAKSGRFLSPELAHGMQRGRVAGACAATAGCSGVCVTWTARAAGFLAVLVSVVKLFPFGTIGLDQVNHWL